MVVGDVPLVFTVVYLALLAERAVELVINRRNARWLREQGAVWAARDDGLLLIVTAQLALFVGVAAEVALAPWAGMRTWTIPLVVGLVLAQALRYWCIATLGRRWSIRVVTLPGAARIVGGPYRWFPHPNYLVVFAEVLLLPLAFGAYATLALVVPLKLVALWRRIRLEERALRAGSNT